MRDSRTPRAVYFLGINIKNHDNFKTLQWLEVNEGTNLLSRVLLKEKVFVTIFLFKNIDFRVS